MHSAKGHAQTAKHILSVVKALCNYLVRAELITTNPLTAITASQLSPPKSLDDDGNAIDNYMVWTNSEARAFLKAAEGFDEYPIFVILLFCGLRLGEAQALRWSDFSEGFNTVNIRRSYSPAEPNLISTPKTRKSVRTLYLGEVVRNAMERAYRHYEAERKKPGYNEQGYVFTRNGGQMMRQEYIRTVRDRIVAAANEEQRRQGTGLVVRRLRLQDMRHFYATTVAKRVEPGTVQAALGHASINTSQRVYIHVHPDDLRLAAISLEDLE